jgi:hypothetical protein
MITGEGRAHFQEEGWVVPNWQLSKGRLTELRVLVESALDSYPTRLPFATCPLRLTSIVNLLHASIKRWAFRIFPRAVCIAYVVSMGVA